MVRPICAGAQQNTRHAHSLPGKQAQRSWRHTRSACRNADTWLKHSLTGNLDSLVALALIVALLLGSLLLTGFLTVRIGQPPPACLQWLDSWSVIHLHAVCCMLYASSVPFHCCHPTMLLPVQVTIRTYSHHHQTARSCMLRPALAGVALQNICFGLACRLQC